MDDSKIVDLYWQRSEKAIAETDRKYGSYCFKIAHNILANNQDAEESVSDTYVAAWNKLPPHRPAVLSTFLGKITRNISVSRWRSRSAAKRGGGEIVLALEELDECIANAQTPESDYIQKEAIVVFNRFLDALPETERRIFLRRYWCLDPIADIAANFRFSQSKVTSMLHRTRIKLRKWLEKEGFV